MAESGDERPDRPDDGDSELVEAFARVKDPLLDPVAKAAFAHSRDALFGIEGDPVNVGRYTILERLGSGGMGIVYAAYDRDLERKVAIKVLRARGPKARDLVLAEARALARLRHQNVVSVHEAGEVGDAVFVAMELVAGRTLGEWLADRQRTPTEILALLLEAGHGLAAAHAAGVLHHDFKPANVIVDSHKHARVVDFGVARLRALGEADPPGPGTPAYMAPERLAGEAGDPRADQFSFAVTAYEALYGQRPFAGTTLAELLDAIRSQRVEPPATPSRVSATVVAAIHRGLSADPEDRFADMDAMLSALGHRRGRRWRQILAVLVVVTLVGGAFVLGRAGTTRAPSCTDPTAALADIWDDSRRDLVTEAFARTELPYAADVGINARAYLDDWADAWKAAHTDACEATWVRGEQSQTVLDLRMGCLERHLDALMSVTAIFVDADDEVVRRAMQVVTALPAVDRCNDVERLRERATSDGDPALASLRRTLAEAAVLYAAGKYDRARSLAIQVRDASPEGSSVHIESRYHLGMITLRTERDERATDGMRAVAMAAVAAGHEEIAARAALRLAALLGDELEQPAQARHWVDLAEALTGRTGGDAELEASIANVRGDVLRADGRYDDSIRELERARSLAAKASNPILPARIENSVGQALWRLGRYEASVEVMQRALELRLDAVGDGHPDVGAAHNNLGAAYWYAGDLGAAEPHFMQALGIAETAFGSDHVRVADALQSLTTLAMKRGRPADAEPYAVRALAIFQRTYAGNSPQVANAHETLGTVELALGRHDDAIESTQRALEIRLALHGPDHLDVAGSQLNLGSIELDRGRPKTALHWLTSARGTLDRAGQANHPDYANVLYHLSLALGDLGRARSALEHAQRAVELTERTLGPEHFELVARLARLGSLRLERGEAEAAIADTSRALALANERDTERGEIQFILARALWASGDRDAARKHAREAAARLREEGDENSAAEVAAWLARRR